MRSLYEYRNFYYDDDTYELIGTEGEELFKKIIATGCCYWKNNKKELPSLSDIPLKLGSEKKAEWHWEMSADGVQRLSPHKETEKLNLFSIDQVWYCNEKSGETGIMHTNISSKILSSLLALSNISMNETKKIADLFQKHQEKLSISLPKIPVIRNLKKIKPIPCLRLCQKRIKKYSNERNPWVIVTEPYPAVELTFDYNGLSGLPYEKKETVDFIKDDQLFSIPRHQEEEKKSI